jgi:hypothetical protein
MDATSAPSTSANMPPAARGGGVGPIDPKQQAEERREKEDRVQADERVRDQAEKSDAGPGVGVKIDIAA